MKADRYQPLRDAIAAGPTKGPWYLQEGCSWRRFGTLTEDGNVLRPTKHPKDAWPDLEGPRANMQYIAAADPDTIAALLKERNALRGLVSAITANRGKCFIPLLGWDERARAALAAIDDAMKQEAGDGN